MEEEDEVLPLEGEGGINNGLEEEEVGVGVLGTVCTLP